MRRLSLLAVAATVMLAASCTSSAADVSTTEDTQTVGGNGSGAGIAVPSGPPLVEGLPTIVVLGPPESEAGEVPLFEWEPVTGAATYDVSVVGPEGPLWAWRGDETKIHLGGLPFERPPGWAGPVIAGGSCWSVIALDGEGRLMAVSEFLPVSAASSSGHTCVPGSGIDPGA
jgi:hypothetical protein